MAHPTALPPAQVMCLLQLVEGCDLFAVTPVLMEMNEPLLMGSPGQRWLQPLTLRCCGDLSCCSAIIGEIMLF